MRHYIAKFIVFLAYYLDTAHKYKKAKAFVNDVLNNSRCKYKKNFDIFMISIVLLSIALIIYEVKNELSPEILLLEHSIFIILAIEYFARVWVASSFRKIVIDHYEESQFLGIAFNEKKAFHTFLLTKWKYMTTPMAIIDFLAILPNFTVLRFFRIFMIFRLFKLFRHITNIGEFTKVIILKKFEFITVGMLLAFFALLFSTAMFFFEGGGANQNVRNYFDAVYWTFVTMATVGYGDISPVTYEGRIIAIILMLFGVGVISLVTSIMVSAFSEKLDELKSNRVKNQVFAMKDYVILCGYSQITQVVAQKLQEANKKFVIIELDETKVEEAKKRDYVVLKADATISHNLRDVGVGSGAHTIIALAKNDVTNLYITISAKDLDKNIKVISKANTKNFKKKLLLAGADEVFYPYESGVLLAKEYIGQPVAFEALYGMVSGLKDVYIEDIPVFNRAFFVGKSVEQLGLRHHKMVLFGIVREETKNRGYSFQNKEFLFNPSNSEIIQKNDILIVLAHRISINHYKQLIEKSIVNVL